MNSISDLSIFVCSQNISKIFFIFSLVLQNISMFIPVPLKFTTAMSFSEFSSSLIILFFSSHSSSMNIISIIFLSLSSLVIISFKLNSGFIICSL